MEDTKLLSGHQRIQLADRDAVIETKDNREAETILDINESKSKKSKKEVYLNNKNNCFWTVRYIGLAALCILYFVTLVIYESPGALITSINPAFSFSRFDFSQIMSSYSWATIFCSLGGYVVDRVLGLNTGLCVFVSLFVVGNILYSGGMFLNMFWVIIIGRILAGLGGETLSAIVSCYIIHWFSNGPLNFAFAVSNSFSLLAPAVAYQISNPLYYEVLGNPAENNNTEFRKWSLASTTGLICGGASLLAAISGCVVIVIYNCNDHGNRIQHHDNDLNKSELKNIKAICTFKAQYWTLTGFISLVYLAMYNFVSLSQDFFANYCGLSVNTADNLISQYSFITFLTSPMVGFMADRSGNNMAYLGVATVGALTAHVIFATTHLPPALPVIILALSMAVFVSTYSALIREIVEPNQVATAYGITYAITNSVFALGIMLVGLVTDNFGYYAAEYFHIATLIGAFLFWCVTWILQATSHKKIISVDACN